VFLTSLTIRGFKSFADATTLEVEPGVTVIVGPNGSGKSNVVDSLAWVLGTGSAKRVRGGSMSDVIFAGSPNRKALGQARVEIAIDNSDGRLGTDALGVAGSAQGFAEVKVSRTIYTSGENVYAINGQEVRALDVQELLSDTGLGKELHTIVGQGQLDEILQAKPEERRKYIEEAAGILKHRRRRERALRKLDQVDLHIEKLLTVLRELRRQLRPLERQAEAASKAQKLQSDLRLSQVRLAAHDLGKLEERLSRQGDTDADADARLDESEGRLSEAKDRQEALEIALAEITPAAEKAQQTRYKFGTLLERMKSAADLVDQRRRHLLEWADEPLAGRDPSELRAHADRLDEQGQTRQAERATSREAMEEVSAERRSAEGARREHETKVVAARRRAAEQRESVLRWEGQVQGLRGGIAGSEAEVGRLDAQLASLDERAVEVVRDVDVVQTEIQELDAAEVHLTETLELSEAEVELVRVDVTQLEKRIATLERDRSGAAARAEVLRAALQEREGGAAALLDAGRGGSLEGVLAAVAELVRVEETHQVAMSAALGALGEAVVVSTPDAARRAIGWLRENEAGAAVVLSARDAAPTPAELTPAAYETLGAADAIPAASLLAATDADGAQRAVAALKAALGRTWVVGSWDAAVLLHGRLPWATFVTNEGDIAGPDGFRGGERPADSAVSTASNADEAEARATELTAAIEALELTLAQARASAERAAAKLKDATLTINASDAGITAAAERLARLHKEQNGLHSQRGVVEAQHTELLQSLARTRDELAAMQARGPAVEQVDEVSDSSDDVAAALDLQVEQARERELDARVKLERLTEQVRHLELQSSELREEADEVERSLAEAARRRARRQAGIARCGELAATLQLAIAALERTLTRAEDEREALAEEVRERRQQLQAVRAGLGELEKAVVQVRAQRHQAELARHELALRRDELVGRVRQQFGLSPQELLADHADAMEDERPGLVELEDVLTRKLGLLGRVNPLALEEFKALEERHGFLSGQLDDLRRSKRDLGEVIVAVDGRIRDVFQEAFEDVAVEFERIFQVVFPGGDGRLVLTDPTDMLTTGIEIEARPPGKRVTRMSLLSGGERSLTVLAFVFAIFRARPSPFYVLDEVDAALDDVNLQRLLRVIESFRGHSQIIMVTHQKRSMEVADLLYGVTMGRDGVTKVVADRLGDQRLELEPNLPAPTHA
jgi:chromosome segregation protein